ncbi:MAG: hypothetical protein FWB87_13765 [Defluviitaleaceae bacterium]|nr:hypothetical protein [Defluviitaleaceae bacterium]
MTIKDLEQYRKLVKEIALLENRIDKLANAKSGIVSDSVRASSHNAPYQPRIITLTGLDQRGRIKYEKLMTVLNERLHKINADIIKIETFISTVPNSDLRLIIDMHYMQGLSWRATALKVYDYPCADRARMVIKRYLKKCAKKS